MKIIIVSIIAILVIMWSGFGVTVAAAQTSLPGDALYGVKLWSEDLVLMVAEQTQYGTEVSLDLADRRVEEIAEVLEDGEILPEEVLIRYQEHISNAFAVSVDLDDDELREEQLQLQTRLQAQEKVMNELQLQAGTPEDAVKAMVGEMIQARIRKEASNPGVGDQDRDRLSQQDEPEVDEGVEDDAVTEDIIVANPEDDNTDQQNGNSDEEFGAVEPYQPEHDEEGPQIEPYGPWGNTDIEPNMDYTNLDYTNVYKQQWNYYNSYGTNNTTSQNQNKKAGGNK